MQCRRFNLAAWYEVSKAHSQLKCPYLTCIWKKLKKVSNLNTLTKKDVDKTARARICYSIFATFLAPGSGSGFPIRIRIQRPDWIRIQSGSGSETLAETSHIIKVSFEGCCYNKKNANLTAKKRVFSIKKHRNIWFCFWK